MRQYTLGLDFGSLSGRAVLLDIQSGEEVATAVCEYAHGVMSESLPDGTRLPSHYALQHPMDYIEVLRTVIPAVMAEAGITAEQIAGVGVDCTASTVLPVYADGAPLCCTAEFASEPHAYIKLWKHHAAQPYADRLNCIAAEYDPQLLSLFGGRVSSEWLIPKVMETLDLAPAVYEQSVYMVEMADWLVWQLSGRLVRNACLAGYKSLWNKRRGYPSSEFFARVDPRMRDFTATKLAGEVLPCGARAGEITRSAAVLTGLRVGTPVAVAGADAHSAIAGCGVSDSGHLLIVMGTSACHLVMDTTERTVDGICGAVEDGMLPDLVGYEAGQSGFGDHIAWLEQTCLPRSIYEEAEALGLSPLTLLTRKAEKLRVGESGLLALDFWNGNRSVLDKGDLSGLLIGMTLDTKPEEIYRTLIEALAFGTRVIIERFRDYGVPIDRVTVCGGIPHKNPFLLQVFADVLGLPLAVAPTREAGARGSAVYAAAAAGVLPLDGAVRQLGASGADRVITPCTGNAAAYDALYAVYRELYFAFGEQNTVMETLKKLKNAALPLY